MQLMKHVANAMQHTEGFVLKRALGNTVTLTILQYVTPNKIQVSIKMCVDIDPLNTSSFIRVSHSRFHNILLNIRK